MHKAAIINIIIADVVITVMWYLWKLVTCSGHRMVIRGKAGIATIPIIPKISNSRNNNAQATPTITIVILIRTRVSLLLGVPLALVGTVVAAIWRATAGNSLLAGTINWSSSSTNCSWASLMAQNLLANPTGKILDRSKI